MPHGELKERAPKNMNRALARWFIDVDLFLTVLYRSKTNEQSRIPNPIQSLGQSLPIWDTNQWCKTVTASCFWFWKHIAFSWVWKLPCCPLLLLRFGNHHMQRYTFQPSMSDTRQAMVPMQSSQPSDLSRLGSKSQDNKPPENTFHQTSVRREVKQQVSRHSNQENELQETKNIVPLPPLNPKYSSIQPTSGPFSPPDQFFQPQESTCVPFHPTYVFRRAHDYLYRAKS